MQLKLEILNGLYSPGDPIPSLNELVKRFPISKITARRVHEELVQAGMVRMETGRGAFVLEPKSPPRPIERLQRGDEIAMLVDTDAEAHLGGILRGMQAHSPKLAHRMTIQLTGDSEAIEAEALYDLFDRGVRHFVVFPVWGHAEDAPNLNLPIYLELNRRGAHVLLISNNCQAVGLSSLGWHVRHLMREMVDACRQASASHPVMLIPAGPSEDLEHYIEGFDAGLKHNGYKLPDGRIHAVGGAGESMRREAGQRVQQIFRRHAPVDAVFCVTAEITLGVAQALERRASQNRPVRIFGCGTLHYNLQHLNYPVRFFETSPAVLGRRVHERLTGEGTGQPRMNPMHEWLTTISVHPKS